MSDIVKEQLALSADTALTAESKFSALGADSLDTVCYTLSLSLSFHINDYFVSYLVIQIILSCEYMVTGGDSDGFGGKV